MRFSFEKPFAQEKKVRKITEAEYEILRNMSDENLTKREALMAKLGINYDSGDIELEVEGKKLKIITKKDDFGTELMDEKNLIIKAGVKTPENRPEQKE